MAKKSLDQVIGEEIALAQTFNPLTMALRENDKKNLFTTNVTTYYHKTGFPLFDYYFGSVINLHNELGEIIKQEARCGQKAGSLNLVVGNTGAGKALPNSTLIPTPTGYTRMGDLKVGDKIFGSDGRITQVVGVYPQGKKEVWEMELAFGKKAKCCEDHLWKYRYMSHGVWVDKISSTIDLLRHLNHHNEQLRPSKEYCSVKHLQIQNPGEVTYSHQEIPVDPYTLGVFIGNGCCREKYLTLSSLDDEIPNKIAKINNLVVKKQSGDNYSYNYYDNDGRRVKTLDFFKGIEEMICRYSGEKRIPESYIYNSKITRWELLKGLIDTDGSIYEYDESRNVSVSYSSTSKELLLNMKHLIHSLGLNCTIYEPDDVKVERYKSKYYGELRIIGNISLFIDKICSVSYKYDKLFKVLTSNKYRYRSRQFDYNYTSIKNIKRLNTIEEMTCIRVDNSDGLFITEDFIVTHNSSLVIAIASNIIRPFKNSKVIHFDCEQRMDISRVENLSKFHPSEFEDGGRYIFKTGTVGLDVIQETVVRLAASKLKMKKDLTFKTGQLNEFGKEIEILEPSVIIIDSVSSVIDSTFSIDNSKEISEIEKLRSNTEGARDSKLMRGFIKDILPLCKEANIIVYFINHINQNMSMNAYLPVAKQQNYLKQDESIPGGKALLYFTCNILKLIAKTSDDFTEESDGFSGHIITGEPLKCSSNQSGNASKGVSFDMVFSFKTGFDSLRSTIRYGLSKGIISGTKNKLTFKDDPSFTFGLKTIYEDKDKYPIWENVKKYIIPELESHLSFVDLSSIKYDPRELDY